MDRYISIIAAVISFAVTALLGYIVIPFLHNLKFGQTILDIGPKWHKNKQGTPTMGGIMMILGVLVSIAIAFSVSFGIDGKFSNELKDSYRLSDLLFVCPQ